MLNLHLLGYCFGNHLHSSKFRSLHMDKFPIISGASTKTFWRSFALTVLSSRRSREIGIFFDGFRIDNCKTNSAVMFSFSGVDVTTDLYGRVLPFVPLCVGHIRPRKCVRDFFFKIYSFIGKCP